MIFLSNKIIERNGEKPILYDVIYKEAALKEGKAVIFCHGFKGFKDWGHWNLLCKGIAEAGYIVLKFNFSHNGGTTENPIDFPDLEAFSENNHTKEVEDLTDVIDFVFLDLSQELNFSVSQLSLIGHSRGGGVVLIKAAEDKRIDKIVTWASVDNYGKRFLAYDKEKWKKDGVVYVKNARTKQDMPLKYQFYEDFLNNKRRLNIPLKTQSINIPALICHGTADESVGVSAARRLHSMIENSQLCLIENTRHTFGGKHPWNSDELPEASNELLKATVKFLNEN